MRAVAWAELLLFILTKSEGRRVPFEAEYRQVGFLISGNISTAESEMRSNLVDASVWVEARGEVLPSEHLILF